ncbi:MAG TPA: Na+ dependent nucleoside transporter N-terminal domain-containing protein, partial [Bryobacteraceae bacterium]|nr:Na+ dependent nucleoside transporter N-terminal domain-containing protein [Bryobacteraceae bacterium]
MGRFTGLLGLVAIMGLAWVLSRHRSQIKPRVIWWGLGLQFGFAILVLKTDFGKLFQIVSSAVTAMLGYSEAGASFVFGDTLGKASGSMGVVFAFQVLPIILFI